MMKIIRITMLANDSDELIMMMMIMMMMIMMMMIMMN